MTQEIDLHDEIIVMASVMTMEFPASQIARDSRSEQGGLLRLGEGIRAGQIAFDALTDAGKKALTALIDQLSLGAIVRVPIRQIDPPRDHRRDRDLPADNLGNITVAERVGGTARWTLDSAPAPAWLHRLGSINGRTFRVVSIAGAQVLVSPEIIPDNLPARPDTIANSVIRLQQRAQTRMPILRRAMTVEPARVTDLDVVEVID